MRLLGSRRAFLRSSFQAAGLISAQARAASPAARVTGWTPPRLFDIERAWPWIQAERRRVIRLHPERAAGPLPPAASKIGGTFLWPSREPWPYCRETDPMDMPEKTWEEWVEIEREVKLSRTLDASHAARFKPEERDPAALARQMKLVEEEFLRLKAKGLPPLTASERAAARKSFEEDRLMMAKLRLPHNTAYLAILQLRRDEFPELPWPGSADLFQLLWCPRIHFDGNGMHDPDEPPQQSPGFVLKWRREKLVGPVLAMPPRTAESPLLNECRLYPEELVEYPQASEFDHTDMQRLTKSLAPWFASAPSRSRAGGRDVPDLSWRYSYDVAAAPGTKLLGYPVWWQGDDTPECVTCGARMRLLVTCAGSEDASNPIWTPAARLARREAYENPSGQSWGDLASAYLFYCARQHPLRIRSVVQTT